jgi:TonB family protein
MRFVRLLLVSTLVFAALAAYAAGQDVLRTISGGVLNGKAVSLPKPAYPPDAKAAGIGGAVKVDVLIDENGTVISAKAIQEKTPTDEYVQDNMAPLRDAAEQAALKAQFSPTLLSGIPVRVKGVIVYNFVLDDRSNTAEKVISGGVINGKAIALPDPVYPAAAKAVNASGTVMVQVTIDEAGNVISAKAVSGHPLLQAAAVDAARSARFSPTFLSNEPVKVSGILKYDFVLPDPK